MNKLQQLFENLNTWRHLPAYQLERRADIFFSIYLSNLFKKRLGLDIAGVIPQFPIRIGSILPEIKNNLSFKVDYFVKIKNENLIVLVELKTDVSSRRGKQDWYMEKSVEAGLTKILEGLVKIYKATKAKKKYLHLLRMLQDLGLVTLNSDGAIEATNEHYDLRVIYLQPNNPKNEEGVITFAEFASIIEKQEDELSQLFAQSLRTWATVKAGDTHG